MTDKPLHDEPAAPESTPEPVRIPRVAPEDKPIYDNPFDLSPRTEKEAYEQQRIQTKIDQVTRSLQRSRPWLTLKQLTEMVSAKPCYEGGIENRGLFLFTIDGQVGLQKVHGALLGGHVMVISAAGVWEATRIAAEALMDTRRLVDAYAFAAAMGVDLNETDNPMRPASGLSVEEELRRPH
ncbi:MAG: hypothetical protein HMLKMBBP_01557 [Planctomycetes bacterium]|nr:hypothetical protein [Planctomycetota bacterium]